MWHVEASETTSAAVPERAHSGAIETRSCHIFPSTSDPSWGLTLLSLDLSAAIGDDSIPLASRNL